MYRNPFTPNFGQVPLLMAGRDSIVANMRYAFEDSIGNPDLCTLFTGARRTGKTALLLFLANEAEQRGWISVSTTATSGMLEDLYGIQANRSKHWWLLAGRCFQKPLFSF